MLLFLRIGKCYNEKVLHDGKLSFVEGIGQYSQSLFDTCSQSTCAKLKKYEFCPVDHCGIAHIQMFNVYCVIDPRTLFVQNVL